MGVISPPSACLLRNPSRLCSNPKMARYFKETDIDEFRECFYLYARSGQISTMDELTVIMRSLGMSPTITELKSYMRDKGGKISFADFLEIMHGHSKKESIPREPLEAFRGMDPHRKGYIPAKDLWHILAKWGEKLSPREGLTRYFGRPTYIHPDRSSMKSL